MNAIRSTGQNCGRISGAAPIGMWARTLALAIAAFLALALARPDVATGLESQWVTTDQTAVRLVAAATGLSEHGEARIGLHFRLKSDWKIYWRTPGDAGLPPRIDWRDSTNLETVTLAWPAPERFESFGLETIGYADEVVLPIRALAKDALAPLALAARLEYLVCREICIPYAADLSLTVDTGPGGPTPYAHLINRFQARVPQDADAMGLSVTRASLAGTPGSPALALTVQADPPLQAPEFFVEGPSGTFFGRAATHSTDGGKEMTAHVPAAGLGRLANSLADQRVTVTIADGIRVAEQSVTVEAAPSGLAGELPLILALALLGGLVLNVMPCVLPVLALKLMGAVSHGGTPAASVRRHFLATAAGILVSFGALGATLMALQQAGVAVGWGIQFQQPVFLTAMVLVVSLFAANLWGAFNIRLPALLTRPIEQAPTKGLTGSFATGAFAALLATPCSAPFVGTAAAFALSRGPVEIAVVFLALGLGLALPYLGVAAVPSLAFALPRPGPWMISVRRLLGVALALTGIWLLTVISAQTGVTVAAVIAGIVGVVWLVLTLGHFKYSMPGRAIAVAVAVLCAAALAVPLVPGSRTAEAPGRIASEGHWVAFDEAAIPGLVAQGKVVFVDVTADWCITCKVNKAAVLERPPVADLLARTDVVTMRADWTRPDDRIARYLNSFGRYGIPFNAIYAAGSPRGQALPELLTTATVLERLNQALATGNDRLARVEASDQRLRQPAH
jgi:suppressor for copper-sensitivity B